MKKNVFSRTLAVLASTAVLGAASMMSANAAGESLTISSAEALPGETVTLSVDVACNNNFESLDIVTNFDAALTAEKAVAVAPASGASDAGEGYVTVVAYGSDAIADGSVATINFTVPADAVAGDEYVVEVVAVNTFAIFGGDDIAATVPVTNGVITVVEEETEPTTEETTAEETTAEVTTTTAAAAEAPKTGNNGVAVAVAGLVAAGAAAVVLKKRH